MKTVKYKEAYQKRLSNKRYTKGLLKSAFEECVIDGHWEAFGLLLQDIIEANGEKSDFAKKIFISRSHLYRLFSKNANPRLNTLGPLLAELGLKLTLTDKR